VDTGNYLKSRGTLELAGGEICAKKKDNSLPVSGAREAHRFRPLCGFALGDIVFAIASHSLTLYYGLLLFLGFSAGYSIVLLTLAAEQYGTNIRATVTTSALNMLRATVIPQTLLFTLLAPGLGAPWSAVVVGMLAISLAFWGLSNLEETFNKNLNYTESI
jgi:putative MFS transporter